MLRTDAMATGTVKWFDPEKGFGFIKPDAAGGDVFVLRGDAKAAGLAEGCEGRRVSFSMVGLENGKAGAIDIRLIEDGEEAPKPDALHVLSPDHARELLRIERALSLTLDPHGAWREVRSQWAEVLRALAEGTGSLSIPPAASGEVLDAVFVGEHRYIREDKVHAVLKDFREAKERADRKAWDALADAHSEPKPETPTSDWWETQWEAVWANGAVIRVAAEAVEAEGARLSPAHAETFCDTIPKACAVAAISSYQWDMGLRENDPNGGVPDPAEAGIDPLALQDAARCLGNELTNYDMDFVDREGIAEPLARAAITAYGRVLADLRRQAA